MIPRLVALFLLLMLLQVGCAPAAIPRADVRADAAVDQAANARIVAAETAARAAHGQATEAEAAVAQARAEASTAAAAAEDARAEKRRAEDEARAERELRAAIAAERDQLGWYWTVAGAGLLVLDAGLAGFGWWFGLSRITAGIAFAGAAAGGVALALGLAWSWLPWAAAGLLLVVALVIGWLAIRAARDIDRHVDRAAAADPARPAQLDDAKLTSAAEQFARGTWTAVQRLRGKSLTKARQALAVLRNRAGRDDTPPRRDSAQVMG